VSVRNVDAMLVREILQQRIGAGSEMQRGELRVQRADRGIGVDRHVDDSARRFGRLALGLGDHEDRMAAAGLRPIRGGRQVRVLRADVRYVAKLEHRAAVERITVPIGDRHRAVEIV
jgi:hypothetical protein